ncbi:hypothetical protein H0H81_011094 [Sphagnurus paluster]|uniref:F-box domain-containing protein n=1 Tax=Sphagnurus paluster TaxID=117069 RepID=A0A9P7K544_9AGAR|nr:hypothetical protein H0H81_011094 [Sphagnurus paluster]
MSFPCDGTNRHLVSEVVEALAPPLLENRNSVQGDEFWNIRVGNALKERRIVPILPDYVATLENNDTIVASVHSSSDEEDSVNNSSNTNRCPSTSERQAFSAFVSSRSEDFMQTEAGLGRLQLKLIRASKDLQDEIDTYNSALSPIQLLPFELLIEIFSHAVSHVPKQSIPRKDQPPLSVSQVSSLWRKASLECPALWSALSLNVYDENPSTSDQTTGLINYATLGVHMGILAMPASSWFPLGQLTRLIMESRMDSRTFNNIIIQCHNLVYGSFTIDVDFSSDWPFTELRHPSIFPHLSALRLRVDGSSNALVEVEDTLRQLFFPAIKMFEFSYDGPRPDLSLSPAILSLYPHNTAITIPLTHLVLANVVLIPVELLTMLGACTALEKFAFEPLRKDLPEILADLVEPKCGIPAPYLPSLTSFILVVDHKDLRALPRRLADLVKAWTNNPARRRPLESVIVYDCEDTTLGKDRAMLAFNELRELLGPWMEKDDGVAITESGMVLQAKMVYKPFRLSEQLDWFEE